MTQAPFATTGILYTLIFQKDLDDSLVDATARREIERPGGGLTTEEIYAQVKQGLASDAILTDSIPDTGHSEQEYRDFLVKVLRRLDELRPWPEQPFRSLDSYTWEHMDSARPAARIKLTTLGVQKRLHKPFTSTADEGLAIVLRLKSGTEVALRPAWWPGSKDAALLLHDPDRPLADVLAEFCAATGITADEIAPVTEA